MGSIIRIDEVKSRIIVELGGHKTIVDKIIKMLDAYPSVFETQKLKDDVFFYIRETKNIGFSFNPEKNATNPKKPGFLVIKFPGTDRDYPGLMLDFYFKNCPSKFQTVLINKSNFPSRWAAFEESISKVDVRTLADIFVEAYRQRSGK